MRENWGLTKMSDCVILDHGKRNTEIGRARFSFTPVPDTIAQLIVGNQARAYHGGTVNHFGCALSVTFANDNQRDDAGLISFSPANKAALTGVVSTDQSLTTTTGGPVMAANHNTSTTLHEPQDHPTNTCSEAPSHDDPAAALAALWPRLSDRDRRCLYALAIGFLILSGREVA